MCRLCSEAQETFIHLFTDCPALWRERRDLDVEISGDTAPRFRDPLQLVDFSYIPKINALLEDVNEQTEEHSVEGDSSDQSMNDEDPAPTEGGSDHDMDTSEPVQDD